MRLEQIELNKKSKELHISKRCKNVTGYKKCRNSWQWKEMNESICNEIDGTCQSHGNYYAIRGMKYNGTAMAYHDDRK
jgi:hypothetical protein